MSSLRKKSTGPITNGKNPDVLTRIDKMGASKKITNSSTMPDISHGVSKKKAIEIYHRETLAGKMSRLECLLNQQFISKYGSRKENSPINEAIRNVVRNYVKNDQKLKSLDASMIGELDALVMEAAEKARIQAKKLESISGNTASNNNSSNDVNEKGNGAKPADESKDLNVNQWVVLNALSRVQEEEKIAKENLHQKQLADKFRRQLDEQKREIERQKEQERFEKQRLFEETRR